MLRFTDLWDLDKTHLISEINSWNYFISLPLCKSLHSFSLLLSSAHFIPRKACRVSLPLFPLAVLYVCWFFNAALDGRPARLHFGSCWAHCPVIPGLYKMHFPPPFIALEYESVCGSAVVRRHTLMHKTWALQSMRLAGRGAFRERGYPWS